MYSLPQFSSVRGASMHSTSARVTVQHAEQHWRLMRSKTRRCRLVTEPVLIELPTDLNADCCGESIEELDVGRLLSQLRSNGPAAIGQHAPPSECKQKQP